LNKDGLITQIRIEDITGSYIESPEDSRVLVNADPTKNQVGKYILISEGIMIKMVCLMKIFRRSQYRQELHFDYPVFEKVQEYMWLNQKPEHFLIFYI
jgi:hypothetical protein